MTTEITRTPEQHALETARLVAYYGYWAMPKSFNPAYRADAIERMVDGGWKRSDAEYVFDQFSAM